MQSIKKALETGCTFSRRELSDITGNDDRSVRMKIRLLRREGMPIVAMKDGGYKLAADDNEKRELLNMYRHRAIDELTTYGKLLGTMQVDGQIGIDEMVGILEANI